MTTIKIITDSTSDIPQHLMDKYDITMVPLQIHIGDKSYKDRVTITNMEFYRLLQTLGEPGTTSQPSPMDFYNIYKPLADRGHTIISIHISSDLSGTYQSAILAKSMLPEADIHVFDSRLVSVGLGLLVMTAARALDEGKSLDEVLQLINSTLPKIKIYFAVDTLEFLAKGGRIGPAAAFLGSLLNIKPILEVRDGQVHPVEKIRGRTKALNRLVEMVKAQTTGKQCYCSLAHANHEPGAKELLDKLKVKSIACKETLICELGPVVGNHTGPGLVGIAFYND